MKKAFVTDYVLVDCNDVAGYTQGQLGGATELKPDLTKVQFQDGAIIVKVAFANATAAEWSPRNGAQSRDLENTDD